MDIAIIKDYIYESMGETSKQVDLEAQINQLNTKKLVYM